MPSSAEIYELSLNKDEFEYLRYLLTSYEASRISPTQTRRIYDKLNYAEDLADNPNMRRARAIVAEYRTLRRRYMFNTDYRQNIPPVEMVINSSVLEDPHSREYLEEHIPQENVRWHILDRDALYDPGMLEQTLANTPISGSIQMPNLQVDIDDLRLKELYQKYVINDVEGNHSGFDLHFEIHKPHERKLGFFKE